MNSIDAQIFSLLILSATLISSASAQTANVDNLAGQWTVTLKINDELQLPFGLNLSRKDQRWTAHLVNGSERIAVPGVSVTTIQIELDITHYDSRLRLKPNSDRSGFDGEWIKRRGTENWARMNAQMVRRQKINWQDPTRFVGRWSVRFDGETDPAVGIFEKSTESNAITGTFLTTTGDYRYLAGGVINEELVMSCFDGAHAFLFKATADDGGLIEGSFHSGNWWATSWSAVRDDHASLPDAFKQTAWTGKVKLSDLRFPNLDGEVVALDDERFSGKCRIIEVFGSWCPNCHDAGVYLSELHDKYGAQGLSIVGLAFELTGDFERDAKQVRKYMARTGTRYPVLIAGTSDKKLASETLPILDRVRSYPTMIFLDASGNVRAIYTGFSGPATGDAHQKLRSQFEQIISETLDQ